MADLLAKKALPSLVMYNMVLAGVSYGNVLLI
jgi:hypothetical protein